MTGQTIALIPDYGLFILFGVVALACLAMPLPASMLVLASGAFAATGDLDLWRVSVVTFAAFVVGDQVAFRIAAGVGPRILSWIRGKQRLVPLLEKSEDLLERRGAVAVLLSHTLLSPTCAYVSYLSGAGGMAWRKFTLMATLGAAIWTTVYVALGYVFATQLEQVVQILRNFFGVIFALFFCMACLVWLGKQWHHHLEKQSAAQSQ